MNITFEVLGIGGEEYEFKWVKITIYLDPLNYSKRIRLLVKIILEPNDLESETIFSEPIYIYLQSNRKIIIENDKILNKSEKIRNITYQEGIGADKIVKKANILKIKAPEVYKYGEENRISIKITPEKDDMKEKLEKINKKKRYKAMKKRYKNKMEEYKDKMEEYKDKMEEYKDKMEEYKEFEADTKFGFMIDTVIQNEGVEEESFWKNLSGLSQYAWKFHFKVWSMMEDFEPIEPILTKSSEAVQMFLVVPKSLFKSYGQIVAHPGEEAMHIMTLRDRNTFLLSEMNENEKKEEIKEGEQRIKSWFEKEAMAISWEHGQTGSMSREAVVEHRQAYPKFWTLLIVGFLVCVLAMIPFQHIFFPLVDEKVPCLEECDFQKEFHHINKIYFQGSILLIILFILLYFTANIYNYSFYELGKVTKTKYSEIFLGTMVSSIVIIIINGFLFRNPIELLKGLQNPAIAAFIFIIVTIITSVFKENKKVKKKDIKIDEGKKSQYLVLMIIIQCSAVFFAVFLWALLKFDFDFILLFPYIYIVVVGLGAGKYLIEGKI